MSNYTPTASGEGLRARVQRFGGYLAGMVMPNIGAFIAWGLITALFIPTGWMPNENLAELVGPMITYLLPILIGYTGGRMVHGQRGAVVGAVATMGVVVGADVPMFLGAMIIGPARRLPAQAVRRGDRGQGPARLRDAGRQLLRRHHRRRAWPCSACWASARSSSALTNAAGDGVDCLVDNNLLPLASVIVEPAKVLFLNNAINHGVLGPLGVAEAAETGKSILFMIESNPGPGLGLLLAFLLFGPRALRPSVPGRDDHPVPRRHPRDLLPVRADEAAPDPRRDRRRRRRRRHRSWSPAPAWSRPPSPGSIFAYMAVTPQGRLLRRAVR